MVFTGLIIGIAAFLIIGVFHPIIIKCEYYFTDKVWPIFLIVGIIAVAVSLLYSANNSIGSYCNLRLYMYLVYHRIERTKRTCQKRLVSRKP